ncbi:MAG: outer membrane lipoprotein carrier protein LolA [Acidobacteria bacterium]|nr:outer membrane lipoprotein carrier protein LolA [Acidobacteriota bacterium]
MRLSLLLLTFVSAYAAESLQAVQARMDKSAAEFTSLKSRVKKVSYTAIIKDTTTETGEFIIKKMKGGDVRVRMEVEKPDVRSIALSRKKYEVFLPKINTVQEYDLSQYGKLIDQLLLLGFGTPVAELQKSYTMRVTGTETIDGIAATKVELTPKADSIKAHLKLIEVWIPSNDGNPVQQKFTQSSGDYILTTYFDVKVNPLLKDADVQLTLPKNVKREKPQK